MSRLAGLERHLATLGSRGEAVVIANVIRDLATERQRLAAIRDQLRARYWRASRERDRILASMDVLCSAIFAVSDAIDDIDGK